MTTLCKMFCPQEYVQLCYRYQALSGSLFSQVYKKRANCTSICRFKVEMMKVAQDTTAGATALDAKHEIALDGEEEEEEEEEPL